MKKIKNIQELQAEKKKLEERQAELEKAIKYDWRDVKESLKPGNIAGQFFSGFFKRKEKTEQRSFFGGILSKLSAKWFNKKQ